MNSNERLPYNIIYYVEVYSAFTVNTYECHDLPVHSHQYWQKSVFWTHFRREVLQTAKKPEGMLKRIVLASQKPKQN